MCIEQDRRGGGVEEGGEGGRGEVGSSTNSLYRILLNHALEQESEGEKGESF